jgi:hypothetical protein
MEADPSDPRYGLLDDSRVAGWNVSSKAELFERWHVARVMEQLVRWMHLAPQKCFVNNEPGTLSFPSSSKNAADHLMLTSNVVPHRSL